MAVVSYKDTVNRVLKNPMRKTFTFLGVTLIMIVVFLMGAIKPTISTIRSLQAEIKARQIVDSQLQTKLNNIQTLQTEYREKKNDLEVIDLYFPANSDYSLVMASFEKITERYGFTMDTLSISPSKSNSVSSEYSGMEPVYIRMMVTGRVDDITKLIKHFEGLPIVPNIQSVAFSPQDASSNNGLVSVSISMFVYKTIATSNNNEDTTE